MTKYAVGLLVALGFILLAVVLIIRGLVSGPSAPNHPNLTSYADTATSVVLTIDTPVSAASTHNDIIITVDKSAATLRLTRGYDGETVQTQTYPLSVGGYSVFLHALALNGFDKGDDSQSNRDERGQCALGERFIYEIIDPNGSVIQHYWHTSCDTGTSSGEVAAIRQLFIAQIPDYNKLTNDVSTNLF